MGTFFVILGSILAAISCGIGALLGWYLQTGVLMGQPIYQFLGLSSIAVGWAISLGIGLVLAVILGLPLIAGGMMYRKGQKALRKARRKNRESAK